MLPFNTDLYELTMAQGFFESGLTETKACFNVFFRECPFDGGYAVACGTGQVAELVENFRFDEESIKYLSSLEAPGGGPLFKPAFLSIWCTFRMHISVWGVPEGEVVFPREPLESRRPCYRLSAFIETALLNLVNFQTLKYKIASCCSGGRRSCRL